MSEFTYLYRGGTPPQGSPEQMQRMTEKWITWLETLAKQGHVKDRGRRLAPSGRILTGSRGAVTDGPFAEAKDLIGGYSIIEARDLAQAVELAKGCPIFEVGGVVEVRAVAPVTT